MKSILKIFIILIITLSTSACFDNLYNIHINGVAAPVVDGSDVECNPSELFEIESGKTYYTEGLMDLAYSKIVGSKSGIYGYILRLNVFNLLSDEEVDNVNTMHIKRANVTITNNLNNLVAQETITVDYSIFPRSAAVIPLRILNNRDKWQRNPDKPGFMDLTREFFYQNLYDVNKAAEDPDDPNGGLLTPYVIVKVTLEGETLGGFASESDTFEFKINLCVNCLICPINNINCQNDNSFNPLENIDDITYYCPGLTATSVCGMANDQALQCIDLEGN